MIPFYQVDAFTDRPFAGNPAGVTLLTEQKLDADARQAIAAEVNCSETAFIELDPDGESTSFGLRWFTPTTEVDLCGHATLAAAHTLWDIGRVPSGETIRFGTNAGALSAHPGNDDWIWMDFPAEPPAELNDAENGSQAGSNALERSLSEALGVEPTWIGRTPRDLFAVLPDENAVRTCEPDLRRLGELDARGTIVTAPTTTGDADFVSRFFAPAAGVPEDPVTGSAHCALGPYWARRLDRATVTGFQCSSRGGTVRVRTGAERVELGGRAVTTIEGTIQTPSL